ncbi:MAG: YlbF family regulator, partial [Acetatifactor sp.]|nr:YlbF family regulator [Acetatifactor sp.]
MRLEGDLDQAVENLIVTIKESDAYDNYLSALAAVKRQPGLKQQIDEYRKENYVMQNTGDMAFERIERFEQEYSDFRESPLVA